MDQESVATGEPIVRPHGYFYQKYYKPKREEDVEYKAKKNEVNRKCMNDKYHTDEEHRAKAMEYSKKYYQENKERCREYIKQYHADAEHKAKISEYKKKYNEKNRERNREYMRQYYLKKKAAEAAAQVIVC